jgi:deoxyribose-phosphate aldolase
MAVPANIQDEAKQFASQFHFGVQGIEKNEAQMHADVKRLIDLGYTPRAFDTELNYLELVTKYYGDRFNIHVPLDYPMGRSTTSKKLRDLEYIKSFGCMDNCVCMNYEWIFSHEYAKIEGEIRQICGRFGGEFEKMAFVIPAALMSDQEIINTVKALDAGGAETIKVNPGCGLGASFWEVELIYDTFGHERFDVHPSGNIRTLEQVERFLALGCTTIHSRAMIEITESFIAKRMREERVL